MKPTWQTDDGAVQLYLGDCLDILPTLGNVDAVVTDPPYGITSNKWDRVLDFEAWWREAWRICRGPVVMTASQPFTSAAVMSQLGSFKHEWIWQKNRGSNFANTVREPFKEHESILVFARRKWTYNPQRQKRNGSGAQRAAYKCTFSSDSDNYREMERRENVELTEDRVPSSIQAFNTETGLHPTQKPQKLFEYMVMTYTNEGDVVLDPFMGSGTTGVACIRTGRRFIGIEKEPKYFEIAKRRIMDELNRTPLFDEPKLRQRSLLDETKEG